MPLQAVMHPAMCVHATDACPCCIIHIYSAFKVAHTMQSPSWMETHAWGCTHANACSREGSPPHAMHAAITHMRATSKVSMRAQPMTPAAGMCFSNSTSARIFGGSHTATSR